MPSCDVNTVTGLAEASWRCNKLSKLLQVTYVFLEHSTCDHKAEELCHFVTLCYKCILANNQLPHMPLLGQEELF